MRRASSAARRVEARLETVRSHQYSDDFRTIKPINFEAHCASCHPLEFDARLPGSAVPHGEPDVVFNYLFAEYAKLFLVKEGREEEDAGARRRRKPGKKVQRGVEIDFSRKSVEAESRSTEKELFTRTACHLCHLINEVEAVSDDAEAQKASKYAIIPPEIPERWMPRAIFDHGAHQEVACESCHVGVRESVETTDLLLPGIDNCRQCHVWQPIRVEL